MALGSPHQCYGFIHIKGLRQVLEGAALIGIDRTVQIGVRRHDDDRNFRLFFLDQLQQRETIDTRHADIGENDLREIAVQRGEQTLTILKGTASEPFGCQGAF